MKIEMMMISIEDLKFVIEVKSKLDIALLKSIQNLGILNPILISKDKRILDGVQRYLIAKELGIERILCIIIDITEEELIQYMMIKPIRRTRITNDELGKMCKRIIEINKLSLEELAHRIGRSVKTVKRWIKASNESNNQ